MTEAEWYEPPEPEEFDQDDYDAYLEDKGEAERIDYFDNY